MSATGPTPTIVQRLRVATEAAGSYGVDKTATLGDFQDLPFMEGSLSWEAPQETHNALQALQDLRDYQEEILGKKTWKLSFKLAFAPTGVAVGSAVTATAGPLSPLLTAIMGGEFKGTGSTAVSWATAGGGTVASAAGFRAGGVAGMVSSSVLHLRPVKQVTGSSLVVRPRFPATPATGAVIYSGTTYYETQDPKTSLQFIIDGQEAQDRWVLMGGQGTVTPELNLDGEIQSLAFEIVGTKWLHGPDAAGTGSLDGSDIAAATYARYEPITGQAGELMVKTNGALAYTGAPVHASALAFARGLTMQPITSPSGVEGVLRFRKVRASGSPPVSGSFSTYFEDVARWTSKANKHDLGVFYRNGVTAGSVVAIEAPTVQIINPARADVDGIAGVTVEWKGRKNATTTLPTAPSTAVSDMGTSPFLIHLA